ncbi:MAG: serine/threonine protein kinase [Polyangiaceae bacterium]|nr:serine/threonine protein kinase [Polyangiaceae bacterium]MBK8940699.1 serine/threonine protein kinase [Polyangiaceae bacterium]
MSGGDEEVELVGATLPGGWRIVGFIGEGAMARVYEGRGADGTAVAVKLLHRALLKQADVAFRFRREAELLEAIDSPHVPKVLGRGRDETGRFFQVLELVHGESLHEVLSDRGTVPYGQALEIALQICAALKAAHAAGIVHRDLKPENVVVSGLPDRPAVKLLDFSVSKDENLSFTKTGVILGTPSYMAPEQAHGESSPQVDVYGVGAILYDMLLGRPPHLGDVPGKVLAALLTEAPPTPRSLAPHLSRDAEAVLLKAIARSPRDRYASAVELAAALEGLIADSDRRSAVATDPPPAPDAPVLVEPLLVGPTPEVRGTTPRPNEETSGPFEQPLARSRSWVWLVVGVAIVVATIVILAARA